MPRNQSTPPIAPATDQMTMPATSWPLPDDQIIQSVHSTAKATDASFRRFSGVMTVSVPLTSAGLSDSSCRRGAWFNRPAARLILDPQLRVADHLAPLLRFGGEELGERFGR